VPDSPRGSIAASVIKRVPQQFTGRVGNRAKISLIAHSLAVRPDIPRQGAEGDDASAPSVLGVIIFCFTFHRHSPVLIALILTLTMSIVYTLDTYKSSILGKIRNNFANSI
jgi:hypothetical protein